MMDRDTTFQTQYSKKHSVNCQQKRQTVTAVEHIQGYQDRAFIRESPQNPVKVSDYSAKDLKHAETKLKKGFLRAKFKLSPTLTTLMVLQVNQDTISLVERCQTYECEFLLFLIPFAYLLGETLTYFQTLSAKTLWIYPLFMKIIQKISYIQNSINPQVSELQGVQTIAFLLRYDEHQPHQIAAKLSIFLGDHGQKLQTFIPAYHRIFSFHAIEKYQFIHSIQSEPNLQVRRSLLKNKLREVEKACLAYNNEEI